jgi:hypothetical protein
MDIDIKVARVGMSVVGCDGEQIGAVKEVHDAAVLVDRTMSRDVYVPVYAIDMVDEGRLVLSVPSDLVDSMHWPSPPLFGVLGDDERVDMDE